MVYWSEFYKEIAERITANLEHIKWVDLWHDQANYLTDELPFPTPAVFVGFNTTGVDDTGKKTQQCNVQIDMYLFYETFSDTYSGSYNQERALEFLNELTRLHVLFHGKSGVHFSAMRRTDMNREESGGTGNLYRISFECLVTDYSAQELFAELENSNAELEASNEDVPPAEVTDEEPMFDVG
jgi:hypothetical protein